MAHPKVHSTRCISARRCVYATGALRCQHCIRFYYDDCDITQRISNLPAETAINVGQQIQSDTKEEPHELTQYSTTAEKVWEWLADGANILVIGCDVGTKNSSASWLCIDKNQQLSLNFRLQSRHVQHAGDWRIPTQAAIISQDGVAQLIFSPSDIDDHLGDDLEAGDIFTLLKLGLAHPNSQTDDEEKKMVTAAQDANNLTLERYRSANSLPSHVTSVLDIFREFLKYFWGIIRADIASRIPLPEEVLDHVLQEYTKVVVAVPAIWTSTMNNRFRGLLRDAGFPGAHIRSEPKLAAAVVVREQQQRLILDPEASAPRLEQAQRLLQVIRVVLNVGGGTADLNTLQVTATSPILKFRTLMVGTGSMSGNELLNHFFRNTLSDVLHAYMDDVTACVGMSSEEVLQSFVRGFEMAKRGFAHDTTGLVKVHFHKVKDTEAS